MKERKCDNNALADRGISRQFLMNLPINFVFSGIVSEIVGQNVMRPVHKRAGGGESYIPKVATEF